MSNAVRLSSKLAKDEEVNGLDSIAEELVAAPSDQVFFAFAWITAPTVNKDKAHGTNVPTVFIKRIEPLGTMDSVPQHIVDLAAALQERRTGNAALPFGAVEVIEGRAPSGDGDDWDTGEEGPEL